MRNTGAVTLVKALDHEATAMIEVIITLTGNNWLAFIMWTLYAVTKENIFSFSNFY